MLVAFPTFGDGTLRWRIGLLAALAVVLSACDTASRAGKQPTAAASSWRGTPAAFSPAHETFGEAARDFFGIRPTAVQPIPFPHDVHVAKGLTCTEYCHESATKGPIAGLPSVNTCMICHSAIATDRPAIQALTERQQRGLDIAWQRVYGYPQESHVRFHHAAHLSADVDCSTCHGNVAEQGVAERVVDMTMGFCVNCHGARQVSNDCLVCHF